MSTDERNLASFIVCSVCNDAVEAEEIDRELMTCHKCLKRAIMRRDHEESRQKARKVLGEIARQARPDAIMAPHISEVYAGIIR